MRTLYKMLRIVADIRAVVKGRVPQRIVRRTAHKALSRAMRGGARRRRRKKSR